MSKETYIKISDIIILSFLSLQIISSGFSIALSSISFGIWGTIWLIKIIFLAEYISLIKFIRKNALINIFILLYIITEFISRLFSLIPYGSLTGFKHVLLFMIFWGSITMIVSKKRFYSILTIILICYSLISLVEIIRFINDYGSNIFTYNTGDMRIGYFGYPITNGEIKMLIFITVFPFLFSKNKLPLNRSLIIASIIPIFTSMILTQSRNVFITVFITVLIFTFLTNKKIFLSIIFIVPVIYFLIPKNFQERINSTVDYKHPSNYSRLVMWETGLKIFIDHPIIGVGDNEITKVYSMYKNPEYHGEGSHLHSNFIMILATTGLVGFFSFIGMFIAIISRQVMILKKETDTTNKLAITGSLLAMISFHISGIFEWSFGDWEVLTVLLFIISIPFITNNFKIQNGQRTY